MKRPTRPHSQRHEEEEKTNKDETRVFLEASSSPSSSSSSSCRPSLVWLLLLLVASSLLCFGFLVPVRQQLEAAELKIHTLKEAIERSKQENTQIRASLVEAQAQAQAASAAASSAQSASQPAPSRVVDSGTREYPYPKGECVHPPVFDLLDSNGNPPSHLNQTRVGHRHITDPHGLTLNLEWVTRGGTTQIGDFQTVAELTAIPTQHEFMSQYVLMSRPFVVRNATKSWSAYKLWTDEYLAQKLDTTPMQVRRDRYHDGIFHYDREAQYEFMSFRQYIESTQTEEERAAYVARNAQHDADYTARTHRLPPIRAAPFPLDGDHLYLAQAPLFSRGRRDRLSSLCDDLEHRCPQPAFAKGLTMKSINMWFGRGTKTVHMHNDNNEGIMAMLSGEKKFTLWSPHNRNYLYPMIPNEFSAISSQVPDGQVAGKVPLDTAAFPCFAHARSVEVTLRAGDLFFLPAYWFHRVESSGRSLGINWWFATHSLMLQQFMKAMDLNVDVTERDGTVRPQLRW